MSNTTTKKHGPQQPSKRTLEQTLPYILFVGGALGIIASFVITYDKFKLLVNPNYHPACSINPVISCGSVMSSPQGSAFGFPNSFMGLIGIWYCYCHRSRFNSGSTIQTLVLAGFADRFVLGTLVCTLAIF